MKLLSTTPATFLGLLVKLRGRPSTNLPNLRIMSMFYGVDGRPPAQFRPFALRFTASSLEGRIKEQVCQT